MLGLIKNEKALILVVLGQIILLWSLKTSNRNFIDLNQDQISEFQCCANLSAVWSEIDQLDREAQSLFQEIDILKAKNSECDALVSSQRSKILNKIVSTNEQTTQEFWLTILVPTVKRERKGKTTRDPHVRNVVNNLQVIDYLSNTLLALEANLKTIPKYYHSKIKVVVFNSSPSDHIIFEENAAKFESNPLFDFIINNNTEPIGKSTKRYKESDQRPGPSTRKQTRDVADGIKYINANYNFQHLLFMEDDFDLCVYTLNTLPHLIDQINRNNSDWNALRVGFGLNGVLIQQKDAAHLANHLTSSQFRRPPDHLTTEWIAGETPETELQKAGRPNVAFRYNLMRHLGVKSSVRKSVHNNRYFPTCWGELLEPITFKVEAFDPEECPDSVLWPCGDGVLSEMRDLLDAFSVLENIETPTGVKKELEETTIEQLKSDVRTESGFGRAMIMLAGAVVLFLGAFFVLNMSLEGATKIKR